LVLSSFTETLCASLSLVAVVNDKGPSFFKETIPLHLFVLHPNLSFRVSALDCLRILVSLCPRFGKWESCVDCSHPEVKSFLEGPLSQQHSTSSVPSLETLSSRLLSFAEDAGKVKGRSSSSSSSLSGIDSISDQMDNIRIDTPLFIQDDLRHVEGEMIQEGEKRILASIITETSLLRKARLAKSPELEARIKSLQASYQLLIDFHHQQQERKLQRLNQKIQGIKAKKEQMDAASWEKVDRNIKLQKRAIDALLKLYNLLAGLKSLIGHVNISSELCFINQEISMMIDASFSVVVAGQINSGKSTVVNCITGRNLSPNRSTTMTAIPTNYVHDPSASEPVMVVPFFAQLNQVVAKIKSLISEVGLETLLENLDALYLRELIVQINEGLSFQDKYKGGQEIMKMSILIHDLFRLAVHQNLADLISSYLPLDWSEGLERYLTIYSPFYGLNHLSDLVSFSIIDTPGINEAGVVKLNLRQMIKDTLGVAAYAALVARYSDIQADGSADLKNFFFSAKSRYNTPMVAIVTHWDQRSPTPDDKENAAALLTNRSTGAGFSEDQIFLVSAKKMFISRKMLQFLDGSGKPRPDDPNQEVKDFVRDFIIFGGKGSDDEEKEEWYAEVEEEELRKRTQRLEKNSFMTELLEQLTATALDEGLSILVKRCSQKTKEGIENFMKRFQSNSSLKELEVAMALAQKDIARLKVLQGELSTLLTNTLTSKKEATDSMMNHMKLEVESLFQRGIRPLNVPFFTSFTDYVQAQVFRMKDPQLRRLLTEVDWMDIDQETLLRASTQLPLQFRTHVRAFLLLQFRNLPAEILEASEGKRSQIEKELQRIGDRYKAEFHVSLDHNLVKEISLSSSGSSEIPSLELNPRRKRSSTVIPTFLRSPQRHLVVNPRETRAGLAAIAKLQIDEVGAQIKKEAERQVKQINSLYIGTISGELNRLQEAAQDMVEVWKARQNDVMAPFKSTITSISAILAELALMADQS